MDQAILYVRAIYHDNRLFIKSCTFNNIKIGPLYSFPMIVANIPIVNVTVDIEDCKFYSNENRYQFMKIHINDIDGLCSNPTNISIKNYSFAHNVANFLCP